jgi:hypothetical protein
VNNEIEIRSILKAKLVGAKPLFSENEKMVFDNTPKKLFK